MNRISEVSNNVYPQKTNQVSDAAESFSDIFSEALSEDTGTKVSGSDGTGPVFVESTEDTLAKAIEDSLINNMLTSTASPDGAYSFSSGSGIESMLLANAANGEIDDSQLAIFMLYMLMNTAGEDSEMSMLYGVMSALLSGMTTEITTDAVGDAPGALMPTVAGWDQSNYARSESSVNPDRPSIYTGPVKSTSIPKTSGSAILPTAYWKSATPAIVGSEDNRSAENLRTIIDQFDVENAARYEPRDGYTYCNIFLWDVTSALGCEIPHYVDPDTGEPMTYPDVTGAMELNSNRTLDWLITKGGEYGWREVSAEEAQNAANAGLPAVGVWKNAGGVGHVQVVCPSQDGQYNETKGPTIAQAGRKTLNYAHQSSIYSASGMSKVRYFVHD